MGIERLALGAVALLAFQFCGSDDDEAETEVPAIEGTEIVEVAAPGELPAPLHGGTVVAAGEHPVEVVAHQDGNVHAFVLSPEAPPPAQTQMTVHVTGDDGARHPVLLVWDPGEARYRGQLRRVQPAPGPVEVVLVSNGHTYRGSHPTFVVIGPRPALQVEGPARPTVVVERSSPTVVVERPSPTVVVERRSPTIVVERPTPHVVVHHPRPQVVVQSPRPSVVVHHSGPRVRHDNGRHLGHRRGNVRVRARGPGRGHGGRVRVRAR